MVFCEISILWLDSLKRDLISERKREISKENISKKEWMEPREFAIIEQS